MMTIIEATKILLECISSRAIPDYEKGWQTELQRDPEAKHALITYYLLEFGHEKSTQDELVEKIKEVTGNRASMVKGTFSKRYKEINDMYEAFYEKYKIPLKITFAFNGGFYFEYVNAKTGFLVTDEEKLKRLLKNCEQQLRRIGLQPKKAISFGEPSESNGQEVEMAIQPRIAIEELNEYFESEVQVDKIEDIDDSGDYLFSSDVTAFIGASTFIEPLSNRVIDPKAARLFASVAQAFCNGAKLVLPLPAKEEGSIPLYSLWQSNAASVPIEAPKLSEEGVGKVGADIERSFVRNVKVDSKSFVTWIASQFSNEVVKEHLIRTQIEEVSQYYGNMARQLIDNGKMVKFLADVNLSIRSKELSIPDEYEVVLNKYNFSIHSWCLAYLLSVCIRAVPYSMILHKKFRERVVYKYHWIRNPVGQTYTCGDGGAAQIKANHYNWGRLLVRIFGNNNPLEEDRSLSRVTGVLQVIRNEFPVKAEGLNLSVLHKPRDYNNKELIKEEEVIIRVLEMAGIKLKEKLSSRPIEDLGYFLGWNDNCARYAIKPISFTVSQDMIEDSKGEDYGSVGVNINRDTFWDNVEDPGIRG